MGGRVRGVDLTRGRVLLATALVAVVVYANAVPLGFALDDDPIIQMNPVVTEGRVSDAFTGPYWQMEPEWGQLYRPVILTSFAVEWRLWDGHPAGFHAASVVAHAAVTAAVTALLLGLASPLTALLGGLLFAVHPVHVEAVANVVGRSELYAAGSFLAGCLIFLVRPRSSIGRAGRLLGVVAAYAVGLGSKEIAVTLPGVLALLAVHPAVPAERRRRPVSELPLFLALGAVLSFYLLVRMDVLGSAAGVKLPSELVGTTPLQRVWTALTLWPQYMRLMFFPADLVADYGPGVLEVARRPGPAVAAGALVLGGLLGLAVATWRRAPLVSLGVLWFGVAVLPVAHLGVHAGVLLAERTLYLPSVGLALGVAGGVVEWRGRAGTDQRPTGSAWRGLLVVAAVILVGLSVRTVTRTPVWDSSFTLWRDLADHHPRSHRALRLYGDVLMNAGDAEAAAEAFRRAAELHPHRYSVLLEAGAAYEEAGDLDAAEAFFERAVQVEPRHRVGWRLLAEARLEAGSAEGAVRAAATGLARAGPDAELWAHLSEAHLLRGDLDAALRARRAALAREPDSDYDLRRLAEILELKGDTAAARAARDRAGGGLQ